MLVVAEKVFDNVVSGAGTSWYSPAQLNERLGGAEKFAVHASVTGLTGTSPTLTVQLEHSGDDQFWIALGAAQISGVAISNDTSYQGTQDITPVLNFVRVRIALGGTSPQCRLKVYVTGHDYGHRSTGNVGMPGAAAGRALGPVPSL